MLEILEIIISEVWISQILFKAFNSSEKELFIKDFHILKLFSHVDWQVDGHLKHSLEDVFEVSVGPNQKIWAALHHK